MKYETLDLAVQAWFENTVEYDPLFVYNIISPKLSNEAWASVYRDLDADGSIDPEEVNILDKDGYIDSSDIEEFLQGLNDYDCAMLVAPKLDYDDWQSVGRDLIAIGVIEVNDEGDEYVVNA